MSVPPSPELRSRSGTPRAYRIAFDREQWIARDLAWATRLNRAASRPSVLLPLAVASRLGDGVLWYSLMLALPFVAGAAGRAAALQMAIAGLMCVTLYKLLKRWAARPRPFTCCTDIRLCGRALDHFSFPSGHTLHAMAFTIIMVEHFPLAGWALWPFTLLVALSRVTLGLHYPSDVAAGAMIGAGIAWLVLLVGV